MPAEATDTLDTRQLLNVLVAVRKGDFTVRMPVDQTGVAGKVADTLNEIIELKQRLVKEYELELPRFGGHSRKRDTRSRRDRWQDASDESSPRSSRPTRFVS